MTSVRQVLHSLSVATIAAAAFMIGGCNTMHQSTPVGAETTTTAPSASAMPAPKPAESTSMATAAPAAEPAKTGAKIIRIDAGADADYKDPKGNTWLADTGFDGGSTTTRDDSVPIAGTDDPGLYHSEHYDQTSFSYAVPNGKYTVNLYFAETWTDASGGDITGPGGRVFSFKVGDQPEVKDFDIAKEAGAVQKAVVKTFKGVNVTDGKLTITFTPGAVQSTEINGIEIIPE